MNPAQKARDTGNELAGWVSRNRVGVGLAGVAVVALAATWARSRGGGAAASRTGGVIVGDPQEFRGAGGYDSTADDVYNALQGEIEGLGAQIADRLAGQLQPVVPAPAPRPLAPVRRFPSPTAAWLPETPPVYPRYTPFTGRG